MQNDTRLDNLMKQFGDQIGLSTVSSDQEGTYTLFVDDRFSINFVPYDAREVIILALLGDWPDDAGIILLERLLRANTPATNNGTCFGLTEGGKVVLSRSVPLAGLDNISFHKIATDIIMRAEAYFSELTAPEVAPSQAPEPELGDSFIFRA